MDLKLVYVSPNGTTRKTTEVLKKAAEEMGDTVELLDIGREPYRGNPGSVLEKIRQGDVVGFGAPAYHMAMLHPMLDLLSYLSAMLPYGEHPFKAFFYLTYSGITSGKAFSLAVRRLRASVPIVGAVKVKAPHLHHDEAFPSAQTNSCIKAFYTAMREAGFAPMSEASKRQAFRPARYRVHLLYPFVRLIGKTRELPIHFNAEGCRACGICEKECPAGAITVNSKASRQKERCIHCYHCVVACPFKAVEAPLDRLDAMIAVNKRVMGMEDPADHYFTGKGLVSS